MLKHFMFKIAWVGTVAFGLVGCGASNLSSGCGSGVALIAIYEGALQNVCGCSGVGENGTVTLSGGAVLTCTVSAGTTVQFDHILTTGNHQIEATGSPTFPPSPINSFHAVTFSTASQTYAYRDAFNTALQGQIVVP
jgi:hypothetical protein